MKVIHVIYDSLGNPWLGGGGAQRTHELYKRFMKNYKVTIYCGNFPNAKDEIDGINYRRIGMGNSYIISRLTFLLLIHFYILFSNADTYIEDIGFPFPLQISRFKKNVIASSQFLPNDSYVEKRGILGAIVQKLFKLGVSSYNYFIVTSSYVADFIKNNTKDSKVIVIPNGINIPKGISHSEGKHFLFLGRIDIVGKGLDTLLKAAKLIKNEDIKIIIAGSGEKSEIKNLNKMINELKLTERVLVRDYLKGKAKEEALSTMYALVFPSRNESFGIVALEAFSYGKPVIGARIGGLKEILENSNASLIIDPDDHKKLARDIERLYENKDLAKRLGQSGRVFANKYSWDNIEKQFEEAVVKFSA